VLNELKNSFFEFALGFFPEKLCAVIEKKGECFHQDIKEIERRYQGRWNVNTIGNYCWMLHREIPETSHKRKSNICSFSGKRKRQYKANEYNLTSMYGNLIVSLNKYVYNCFSSSFI
jgi:hypothetical protein